MTERNKEGNKRTVRCTLQPLREVWMTIGMERIDTHEGVMVRMLLDMGATGMFVDREFAEQRGFMLEKLDRPSNVTNVDRTNNSGGRITHKIECNIYYRGHVERIRMDICNSGRTKVILDMPWLAAHNPEIDWEKREVRMMRCPLMCERNKKAEKASTKETTVS